MKFFVISILLWSEKGHDIKEFVKTCIENKKYIFFRNKNTPEDYFPYKKDIEVLTSIKKDDMLFLRVRLDTGGIYKYYSFGKFVNLENINSYDAFNKYIHHEEDFYLISMSDIMSNIEGIRDKEESGRVFEISRNDALNIARLLKKDPNFQFKEYVMEDYKKLLENNYNLILTGAPGTGKTYLAKQIAAKMIFGNNIEYTEDLEDDDNFKNQCKFVQFHPSYDYTDFVDGLRPIKDSNGNIGFERRDGVFKEFCKRALKNLIDSKKEVSELNYEIILKNYLKYFIEYISNEIDQSEEKLFKLNSIDPKRKVASIKEIELLDDTTISFDINTKSNHNIKKKLDDMIILYKIFISKPITEWNRSMLIEAFGFESRISYFYGFLRAFYEKYNSEIEKELNSNDITIEKVQKKNFVFIIDEINRGEISKIFGELFFAIDTGYRGEIGRVKTQYNNLISDDEADDEFEDGFFVPENVYIIGTMNDIDRSVESMDFAMRRRFAWKEIKAKDTQYMLDNILDNEILDEAKERMDKLNKAIEKIEGFNSSYHIGASYFLKLKNYYDNSIDNKEEAFNNLWENHLKGLLYEYLRGMPDAESKLDELENAYSLDDDN
ncbi:AAA family ATPase [Brachyspira hampsonii]|uniref:AAA family ATPase n=1 Tax=Brachyspira hampsonii TaxID=1287055 RepID=UPI000D49C811|nr:AAA family ATPase [Brachyspira hampsonii]PTY39355.1 hypothetical protein DQ06_01605 [Brachyspira hampsonii bv. II]